MPEPIKERDEERQLGIIKYTVTEIPKSLGHPARVLDDDDTAQSGQRLVHRDPDDARDAEMIPEVLEDQRMKLGVLVAGWSIRSRRLAASSASRCACKSV